MNNFVANLGKPNIQIGGLQIWVHNGQFPDSADYYDGNWLVATAYCSYQDNSGVWIKPTAFLLTHELKKLKEKLESLQNKCLGKFKLEMTEPYLTLEFESEFTNKVLLKVNVAPDIRNMSQYLFHLSNSDIQNQISELKEVLTNYPVRGSL